MTVGTLRKLLLLTLIALHAGVSLCGPSLHAMPGMGHTAVLGENAGNQHQHEGESEQAPHVFSDHCLVCQFLVQGQLLPVTYVTSTPSQGVKLERLPVQRVVTRNAPTVRNPRAPPFGPADLA